MSAPDGFLPPIEDGAADHLKSGMSLPAIALPATNGKNLALATLSGRSIVVVYPWTGRPGLPNPPDWDRLPGAHGSTPELEGFRDLFADYAKVGVGIFGLSGQSTEHQREMVVRLRLPFPVLSDAEGRFTAALGLPTFVTGGANYLKRLSLIVKDGRIETVFYPVFAPASHASELLVYLRQGSSG